MGAGQVLDPIFQTRIIEIDTRLRCILLDIRKNPKLLRTLSLQDLISLGIALIDESGTCPLCETAWSPGELRKFLESRLATADVAQQTTSEVTELTKAISAPITSTLESLHKVVAIINLTDMKNELSILEKSSVKSFL